MNTEAHLLRIRINQGQKMMICVPFIFELIFAFVIVSLVVKPIKRVKVGTYDVMMHLLGPWVDTENFL